MNNLNVFISSKMQELRDERYLLRDLINGMSYGSWRLEAWLFEEDAIAQSTTIREQYLAALNEANLYIGIFHARYGQYTIDEYRRAEEWGKPRLVFIKDAETRDNELQDFLDEISSVEAGVSPILFNSSAELARRCRESVNHWVKEYRMGPPGDLIGRLISTPSTIPERAHKMIGRTDTIERIQYNLTESKRVLLHGFGGQGKTALAAEIVHSFLNIGKAPVLWYRLGRSNYLHAVSAMLRCVNPELAAKLIGVSHSSQKSTIQSALIDADVKLVVLDDAWHGEGLFQILSVLPDDIPLLVTSRHRYPFAVRIPIEKLRRHDSLELLSFYASRDLSTDHSASRLCDLLADNAYALRLAGLHLDIYGLSSKDFFDEINKSPHELEEPAKWATEGRESVSALLDTSMRALDTFDSHILSVFGSYFSPQVTLEMLALLPIGATTSDTHIKNVQDQLKPHGVEVSYQELRRALKLAILEKAEFGTLHRALRSLIAGGLVEYVPENENSVGFYQVHSLTHSYLKSRVADWAKDEAVDSSIVYLRRYKEPTGTTDKSLYPELGNLIGAVHWALMHSKLDEVNEIVGSLTAEGSTEFLIRQGLFEEAIDLLQLGIDAAKLQGAAPREYSHSLNLAIVYTDYGLIDEALRYGQQALSIATEHNFLDGTARSRGILGNIHRKMGKIDEALKWQTEALAIYQQNNDRIGEGFALHHLGLIYREKKEFQKALELQQEAMLIAQNEGNIYLETTTLNNISIIHHIRGNFSEAYKLMLKTLQLSRERTDKIGEAYELHNLGLLFRNFGIYSLAAYYFEQSLDVLSRTGLIQDINKTSEMLAHVRTRIDLNVRSLPTLVERAVTEFGSRYRGWTLHVTADQSLVDINSEELISTVIKDPYGQEYLEISTLGSLDGSNARLRLIQDIIAEFHGMLEKTTQHTIFAQISIEFIGDEQANIQISLLRNPPSQETYWRPAVVVSPTFWAELRIAVFLNLWLTESGLAKVKTQLEKLIVQEINENAILLYVLNRGQRLDKISLHFADSAAPQ